MKSIVIKILVLFTFVFLSNCSTNVSNLNEVTYRPNESFGCSKIEDVKLRLKCIGELVKQIEDIRNSKIVANKEKLDRIDRKYVRYKTTYCLTDKSEKEKFYCFDAIEEVYEPTASSNLIDLGIRMGLGFVFGIATGVYIGN